jgi:hypothetical protein
MSAMFKQGNAEKRESGYVYSDVEPDGKIDGKRGFDDEPYSSPKIRAFSSSESFRRKAMRPTRQSVAPQPIIKSPVGAHILRMVE